MIPYIVKAILCSSLFYLFYFLILEREKFHVFNRFYLIGSILASFVIPLIKIKTKITAFPIVEPTNLQSYIIQNTTPHQAIAYTNNIDYLPYLLLIIYLIVSGALFFRFIKNLIQLFSRIRKNKSIIYKGVKLILVKDCVIPYSFLNYVFVNNESYENGTLEKELLHHEIVHVKQKHSLDIILVELLTILIWFNPLVYLFKRSIQLNHEFLADDSVVKAFNDTQSYQYLLVNKASFSNNVELTSPFNFRITKKRIIMMTKSTSLKVATLKILSLIPVVAIVVFLFSLKVYAQESNKELINNDKQLIRPTINGVKSELLNEYEMIIEKYKTPEKNWLINLSKVITDSDLERLNAIYSQMSETQQSKQKVFFMLIVLPNPIAPTKEQFESFKNDKEYGVWIDGAKVENKALNNYNYNDFVNMSVSQLMKNAINYGQYNFQVNLDTKLYYEKTIGELKKQKTVMLIRRLPNQDKV